VLSLEAYTRLAEELAYGQRHEGLWLKCFTEAGGDADKAKLAYNAARAAMLASASVEEGE
jgi:hypothetical protein